MGEIQGILALVGVISSMIDSGATTVSRMRDVLASEGATPEQLADLDARLSTAIDARTAELDAAGTSGEANTPIV